MLLRLMLVMLVLLMHPPMDPPARDHLNDSVEAPGGLRFLLRDEGGQGVAGATLRVVTAAGIELALITNAAGVAESGPLAEPVVWLAGARLADGTELRADVVEPETGFRLPLLPGQTYDVLLRIDGSYLVIDPAQALAGEDGLPTGPTPEALATPPATLAPVVAIAPTVSATAVEPTVIPPTSVAPTVAPTAAAAPVEQTPAQSSFPWWWLLALICLGLPVALAWRFGRGRAR
jgi:hypothetical protein